MREYKKPELNKYGSVQALTGRLGGSSEEDTLFGKDGTEIAGTGSVNTCESEIDGATTPCLGPTD